MRLKSIFFTKQVIVYLNVLGTFMKHWIVGYVKSNLVVTMNNDWLVGWKAKIRK